TGGNTLRLRNCQGGIACARGACSGACSESPSWLYRVARHRNPIRNLRFTKRIFSLLPMILDSVYPPRCPSRPLTTACRRRTPPKPVTNSAVPDRRGSAVVPVWVDTDRPFFRFLHACLERTRLAV